MKNCSILFIKIFIKQTIKTENKIKHIIDDSESIESNDVHGNDL